MFVQHTSASLTINENASPDVPLDLNVRFDAAFSCVAEMCLIRCCLRYLAQCACVVSGLTVHPACPTWACNAHVRTGTSNEPTPPWPEPASVHRRTGFLRPHRAGREAI